MDDYILSHISKEPDYLNKLYRRTCLERLYPHMCSGHYQGRLLKMVTAMINPRRVLELGTYSGYSALSMAEALSPDAQLHTIEIDDEAADWLKEVFESAPNASKITLHIGDALEIIPQLQEPWDMVFIDANKRDYLAYLDLLLPMLKPGTFILADNTLWGGKAANPSCHDAQTRGIREFNDFAASCPRLETVILPVRDGLTLMRVV